MTPDNGATPENDEQVVTDLAAAATDRALRAAADTIGQMPGAELQDKLSQLRRTRASRSRREVLRQQAELDSLDLDEAAYTLASQAHADGNLSEAARWYRVAAANDFADASFKLATVLDALSGKYLAHSDMPEERGLVTEAANWYLAAFLVGDLEGRDPLDTLIARLDAHDDAPLAADDDGSGPCACAIGGLRHVADLQLAEAVAHCYACPSCQAELAKVGPLIGVLHGGPAAGTGEDAPSDGPLPLDPERSDPGPLAWSPQHSGRKGR
jgi:TPR repeat protein